MDLVTFFIAILWRVVLAAGLALLFVASTQGAGIVSGTPHTCDWMLEGEIQPGDQKRVSEVVGGQSTVCLNSPGGSYTEGLALFLHFAEERIATVVQQQHECASACALAFMGGADGKYGDRFPKRKLIVGARLGFHSPYTLDTDPQPVSKGVAMGIAIVAALLRSDRYNLIPKDLIADMLETGPSDLYYVDTLAKAKKLDIEVTGVPAPKAITTAMLYQACINSDPWMEDQHETADPKEINRRGVSDTPGLYRAEFGPGGFGFNAMESCVVSVYGRPGTAQKLIVAFGYAPNNQSMLQQPPDQSSDKPLWYLLPSSTRIFLH